MTSLAAVAAVKNEVDIIEAVIRHVFSQGATLIRVSDGMSTDGTREVLGELKREFGTGLEVINDRSPIFHQAHTMNTLVQDVRSRGFEWVLPFDADEFFFHEQMPLADALAWCGQANKVYVPSHLHLDWDRRVVGLVRWPKVIVRPTSMCRLTMGNHDVLDLEPPYHGSGFFLRELQFRSFEHFCSKVALNLETLDRSLPEDHAAHYRVLEGLDRDALEVKWQEYQAQPTVHDPVPSSFQPSTAST